MDIDLTFKWCVCLFGRITYSNCTAEDVFVRFRIYNKKYRNKTKGTIYQRK